MSFWEKAGELAGRAVKSSLEAIEERNELLNNYMDEFRDYDDERLIRIFKSSNGPKRIACAAVLKERGYGNSDI